MPEAAGGQKDRALALLLASLSAVGPFCIDAYLPSMPEICRTFDIPLVAAQQTLTAYIASFALMSLWHGAISDAVGRRRTVLSAFALFALASLGCALSPSLRALLFFRALQGMTAGTGMIVGRAIVRDVRQGPAAQRMLALVSMVFAVAPAIAPVIGGWLHHFFGWRAVFFFMAGFAAVVWVWSYLKLPETLPPERRQSFRPAYLARTYAQVMRSPAFLAACLALTFGFSGFFVYVLSAPVFLMQHLKVGETEFLWLFGPVTLGLLTGAWLSGRLAGRLSPTRTVLWGLAAMATAAAGNLTLNLVSSPVLPWAVAPLYLYASGMALSTPSLTLMALDLFPSQRGLASSCQGFIQSLGNSLNAAFIAPVLWANPLRLALGEAMFCLLAAAALAAHLGSAGSSTPSVDRR